MARFQVHLCQKGQKVKVPTEAFLKLSPDTVMLFAPYGYTHQPPLSHPFAHAEPISKGHCWNEHNEAGVIGVTGQERV